MKWKVTAAGAFALLCSSLPHAQTPATCLTFKEAVNIETGLFASGVVVDDFNTDGAADLAVTNQNSNNVITFAVDPQTGMLTRTGQPLTATSPSYVGFVELD